MSAPGRRALAAAALALVVLVPIGRASGAPHGAAPAEVEPRGPDPRTAPVEDRAARRAFYTAPPVVPHDVVRYERDQGSCLRCHLQETRLGRRTAMRTPHPELSNCMQCHVAASTPLVVLHPEREDPVPVRVKNGFEGLTEPRQGRRAHDLAPPTIPHRLLLRENCAACHNPKHPNEAMRMDHPERGSCLQCHVPGPGAAFRLTPKETP